MVLDLGGRWSGANGLGGPMVHIPLDLLIDRVTVPDIPTQGRTQSPKKYGTVIFVATGRKRGSSSYFNQSVSASPN